MNIENEIHQKRFVSSGQKAIVNILYTYHWLMKRMNEVFAKYNLTHQQFNVLKILKGQSPLAIPVGEVKEVMLDKSPDLTRLCDRLVNKKLIERVSNEQNRRQVLIRIKDEGIQLLEEIDNQMLTISSEWQKLSDEEFLQLSELLDKLRG
jgi:DNA-binding MarR family transcriptional regulator